MDEPRSGNRNEGRIAFAVSLAIVWGLLLSFAWSHWSSLYDDAYIYFRYVDNVHTGCGLTFNCGERPVEGFTGPLWLGLLALVRLWTTDLEVAASALGTACLGLAITAAMITARSLDTKTSRPWVVPGCVALVLASDDYLLVNAVSGLETSLACLVITVLVLSAVTDNRLFRTLVVLAILTRPECVLFVVAVPMLPRARQPRYWIPLVVALLGIEGVRLAVFGDLVPNTYWAKAGGTATHAELGAAYIRDALLDFPAIVLSPLSLVLVRARRTSAYLLVVAGLWLAFFLRTGGDVFIYGRLVAPIVPALTALGVAGAAARLRGTASSGPPCATSDLVILGVVLALAGRNSVTHHLPAQHGFDNVVRWKALGAHLARNHPDATIATVPIGAIGRYSQLPLIDLVGLTDRHIARAGRSVPPQRLTRNWIGHERHETDYVLARAPDLIVMSKWRDRPWTVAEARAGFFAEWLLLRTIKAGQAPYEIQDAEIDDGVHWLMFRRVDAVP